MTISELIEELKTVQAQKGDIPVMVETRYPEAVKGDLELKVISVDGERHVRIIGTEKD